MNLNILKRVKVKAVSVIFKTAIKSGPLHSPIKLCIETKLLGSGVPMGGLGGSTLSPLYSEVLTELNRIANCAEN